jgi:hypothetical protein
VPEDRFKPDCIEVRYNNYSEAMFWGSFSYNYKGLCHVYNAETIVQKAVYQAIINEYNAILLLHKEVE